MPYRRLPVSDADRTNALAAIHRKWNAPRPAGAPPHILPQATYDAYLPVHTAWTKEVGEATVALRNQTTATSAADLSRLKLQQLVSHFLQVFQLAVSRGEFSRPDRVYYGLATNQTDLPILNNEPDLLRVARDVIDGEASRVAAGGAPMAMPSAAQVAAALAAYLELAAVQTTASDAHTDEQDDVIDLRADVDTTVLDVWDTLEFVLRAEPGPTRRRRAREWGVVYVARPGEPEDPTDEAEPPVPPPA